MQAFYKNVILGSQFFQLPIPQQQRKSLSLMTTGTAKVWKDAFINDRKTETHLCPGNDLPQFKMLLEGSFADLGRSKDAMQQLQMICQGKEPIDAVNTRFHLLLSKAGINVTQNVPLLIQHCPRYS